MSLPSLLSSFSSLSRSKDLAHRGLTLDPTWSDPVKDVVSMLGNECPLADKSRSGNDLDLVATMLSESIDSESCKWERDLRERLLTYPWMQRDSLFSSRWWAWWDRRGCSRHCSEGSRIDESRRSEDECKRRPRLLLYTIQDSSSSWKEVERNCLSRVCLHSLDSFDLV